MMSQRDSEVLESTACKYDLYLPPRQPDEKVPKW